jgi:hypothetical protein
LKNERRAKNVGPQDGTKKDKIYLNTRYTEEYSTEEKAREAQVQWGTRRHGKEENICEAKVVILYKARQITYSPSDTTRLPPRTEPREPLAARPPLGAAFLPRLGSRVEGAKKRIEKEH